MHLHNTVDLQTEVYLNVLPEFISSCSPAAYWQAYSRTKISKHLKMLKLFLSVRFNIADLPKVLTTHLLRCH